MANRIHIVIADSSAIIRAGALAIIQSIQSLNAEIAECADLSTIIAGSYHKSLDLLLINPAQIGVGDLSQLRADLGYENLKIIALQSSFTDQSTLDKFDGVISIYDTISTISEKITQLASTSLSNEDPSKKELSQREREIIVCVVKGMTNKQIAETLFLSTHTVVSHRRNIASKLQIHSPAGLTIYAIVNKLVSLSEVKSSIERGEVKEEV